jgi:ABC-type glycerol-3-phosphate transport system substrate-binding protein
LCLGLRRRRYLAGLVMTSLLVVMGCGDRIANSTASTAASKTYTITVTGTATGTGGAAIQHTATFTLVVVPSN